MIHLIRHAKPSITGVLLGRADVPLAEGVTGACGLEAAAVYSSPLRRARETADRLFPGREIIVMAELTEITLGEWDGLTWSEIDARWPDLAARKVEDWWSVTPPGGESRAEVERRAARAWITLADGPMPAAVVAHSGINAFLANLAGGAAVEDFQQGYLEIKSYELFS